MGNCSITGLPAERKHRGIYLHEEWFNGAKKFADKYNISEFEAMDIILSYKSGVAILGEEKLDPENLRKETTWKQKIKNLVKKSK